MYKPLITDSSKKFGNNRWLAYSNKLKREIYLFSDLEYEHWLQIETDPNIVDYCEQPIKMEIISNDTKVSSVIDMWVKYNNGKQSFIEIKYTKDLSKDSVKKQIFVQQAWCKANQLNHQIKTENEIRRINSIKLSNLKFIIKEVKNSIASSEETINLIKSHIENQPKTVEQIAKDSGIQLNQLINILCKLFYSGEVIFNIDSKNIGKYTEVWV